MGRPELAAQYKVYIDAVHIGSAGLVHNLRKDVGRNKKSCVSVACRDKRLQWGEGEKVEKS